VTDAFPLVVCWHCTRPATDSQTCGWCGVWLVDLDPQQVPPAARGWLPLARRWGIPDDIHRDQAIDQADRAELETILRTLHDANAWTDVERWLADAANEATRVSHEYIAITCLTIAADHARLRLAQQRQTPNTTDVVPDAPSPPAVKATSENDAAPTWPPGLINALRLGQRLVAEVPTTPGRRAFVDITPIRDDRDALAEREGWQRSDRDRAFRVQHWDYEQEMIDGWDHNVGARRMGDATAPTESALLGVITAWGLRPTDFTYPWNTADPR
jgi:hypothetical protein